jgi:hypothetical protein
VIGRSLSRHSAGPFSAPFSAVATCSYNFHTDQWAALYTKRIDAMIAALKSKGVPVVWVGLPAIRGTKATSDINYLDATPPGYVRAGIIAPKSSLICHGEVLATSQRLKCAPP